jgi:1,4-dihydroxy-2-naphthoyl-CoA hydrolase
MAAGAAQAGADPSPRRTAPAHGGAWLRIVDAFDDQQEAHMTIWKKPISIEELSSIHVGTAVGHLGIEFLEVGDDFISARVPVDPRTRQPYGLLHGGVSVVLAETLGSCGAAFSVPEGWRAVGLDINANHLRGATSGWVTGIAKPVHMGRTTHVWQIDLRNDAGELTCVSRITMAILAPR